MFRHAAALLACVFAFAVPPAFAADAAKEKDAYDQDTVTRDAVAFFGKGAQGIGDVIAKAFKDHGQPVGTIKGEEISGAIGIGLRYGNGTLRLKGMDKPRKVYWQGPSIGFDIGANAAKVYVLVYKLPKADDLFQRFPGIDGSLYYVAGAGINYQQKDAIVLAPIRLGVGLRTGASIGYMHYTRKKTYNPL